MKAVLQVLLVVILLCLLISTSYAQGPIYLPIILSDGKQFMEYPLLSISNGTDTINLLDPGSGIQLNDPYWQPNIAQLKGGGTFVNSSISDGQALVAANYDNVVETIPLRITGPNGYKTVENLRRMLQMLVNAQNYYTASFEQNQVYMAVKSKGDNFLTGYASIYTISMSNISNPFGTPFVNDIDVSQFDTVNLVINREPFFSPLVPGEIIGPLYNLIDNPDFELWNFGITNSQPDSWTDLEVNSTGTNNQSTNAKFGDYSLKIDVTNSTGAGDEKGVEQTIQDVLNTTEYTIIAWVKNDGVSGGTGKIELTLSAETVTLYNSSDKHDWALYVETFTTTDDTTIDILIEILSNSVNTDGTIYVDGLMLLEGDFEQFANDNLLLYLTGSHIVNHMDVETGIIQAGNINYVDSFNIPGDVDSVIRLEFLNNTEPADDNNQIEKYETIRIGLRRISNVKNFDNYHDPPGIGDTSASSDDRLTPSATTEFFEDFTTKTIKNVATIKDNYGRFKLIARVFDAVEPPNLQVRSRAFVGTSNINNIVEDAKIPKVSNNWTILELDKDLDFDLKNSLLGFDQFGYILQAKRDSETSGFKFDYSMLIPTDGGYIKATMNPALGYKEQLTIQNNQVQQSRVKQGFVPVYATDQQNELAVFNDILYIGTLSGELHSFKNNIGQVEYDYGGFAITGLATYNGLLYVGQANEIYATDGLTFPGTLIGTLPGADLVQRLGVFGGRLWIGTNEGRIFTWDGTTLALNVDTGEEIVYDFATYGSTLYAGTGNVVGGVARIYVYDNDTDTWALSGTLATGDIVFSLKTFGNYLYAGTNGGVLDTLYRFDGNSWQAVTNFTGLLQSVGDLEIVNNTLFATGAQQLINVIQSTDGETWQAVYDTTEFVGWRLINYQGVLYVGTWGAFPSNLYKVIFEQSAFNISTFEGGNFIAPNRTKNSEQRHRYFFNYDRTSYQNYINDKALVGIGYRPQYFSLINKDDF